MALGSAQPLVKMRTRNIPGAEVGRCVRLTNSPPSRAECHEIWEPKPSGTLWATQGFLGESFIFTIYVLNLTFLMTGMQDNQIACRIRVSYAEFGLPNGHRRTCRRTNGIF